MVGDVLCGPEKAVPGRFGQYANRRPSWGGRGRRHEYVDGFAVGQVLVHDHDLAAWQYGCLQVQRSLHGSRLPWGGVPDARSVNGAMVPSSQGEAGRSKCRYRPTRRSAGGQPSMVHETRLRLTVARVTPGQRYPRAGSRFHPGKPGAGRKGIVYRTLNRRPSLYRNRPVGGQDSVTGPMTGFRPTLPHPRADPHLRTGLSCGT